MRLIGKLKDYYIFRKQYLIWKKLRKNRLTQQSSAGSQPFVIVACDPSTVGGSRGDEAMIMASIQQLRKLSTAAPIHVVGSPDSISYVERLPFANVFSLPSWSGSYPLQRVFESIVKLTPQKVVILGADCMDGFYSPHISLMLLALHDLLTNATGIDSRLLGFSYNNHPSKLINGAFKICGNGLKLGLRDSYSLERFKKFTGADAELVADAAFMLEASTDFADFASIKTIVDKAKADGMTVIGFNFHPMLRKYDNEQQIKDDALIIAKNLQDILLRHPEVYFLLIPHDDRSRISDNIVLSVIDKYLDEAGLNGRKHRIEKVYRANEIKGICTLIDGLVSSRMHLAIAALGQGKPVMAASYQGKFEGLFCHFRLDGDFILQPQQFISDRLPDTFDKFASQLNKLTCQIDDALPNVMQLSRKNFQ